jgi:hypothetical protein
LTLPTTLSDSQMAVLKVHVGVPAWTAYLGLQLVDQLDLPATLAVYLDLRLVAAEVLELVCLKSRQASVTTGGIKAFTVGPIKIERAPVNSSAGADADAWCMRAALLRQVVKTDAQRRARQGSISVPVEAGF